MTALDFEYFAVSLGALGAFIRKLRRELGMELARARQAPYQAFEVLTPRSLQPVRRC